MINLSILFSKEPTEPASLFGFLRLLRSRIGGSLNKLLLDCPGVKCLRSLCRLLCHYQRRADLRKPCVQIFDLLVFISNSFRSISITANEKQLAKAAFHNSIFFASRQAPRHRSTRS